MKWKCMLCGKSMVVSTKKGVEFECPDDNCSYEILRFEREEGDL